MPPRAYRRRLPPPRSLIAFGLIGAAANPISTIVFNAQVGRWDTALTLATFSFVALLIAAGLLIWQERRERMRLRPEWLRRDLSPQSFCTGCGRLVRPQPLCRRCGETLPSFGYSFRPCKECRRPVSSRAQIQARGLRVVCSQSAGSKEPTDVHPTWVVGAVRPADFQVLSELPGARLMRVEEVSLAYLPPLPGDDLALCVVDLTTFPHDGMLGHFHPLTGLQAIWLGAGTSRLEAHRAIDRLECLTGLLRREMRWIEVLTEDPSPDPAFRQALKQRLGPLHTDISIASMRACRPGGDVVERPEAPTSTVGAPRTSAQESRAHNEPSLRR